MVRLHEEGVNWRKVDIDLMALHASRGEPWTVSRSFHYNPLPLQCRDIFLCNMCCRYAMLNGIIDSQMVRAQKAATSSQSSGSSFIPRRSEDQLKIEMLKESLR
jgi:hypothetical protein